MSDPITPPSQANLQLPRLERRVSVRYPCHLDTFCQQGAGGSDMFWWFATAIDLSPDGIALSVKGHFKPGSQLVVELTNVDASFAVTVPARVVRITAEQDSWIVGCAFLRRLTEAEIEAIL